MRLFCLPLAAVACSTPPAPPAPADATPVVRAIGDRQLDVIVAHERFATVSEVELRAGTRLDTLVANHPLGAWTSISLYGKGVGPVTVLHPSTNYPGMVPRVVLELGDTIPTFELAPLDGGPPALRQDGIDEVRIELAADEPTPLEALAGGCVRPRKADESTPRPPRRWRGSAYQFNTEMNWRFDLIVDLGVVPVGSHVGTLRAHARYAGMFAIDCVSDLYRAKDRGGQRIVVEKVRSGECVDGTIAFSCSDGSLKLKGFYASGRYVLYGTLDPDP